MCEELAKLFEPEIKEAKRIARTEGRAEGRAEGKLESEIALIRRKYEKGCDTEQTADMIEQEVAFVSEIYKLLQDYPECSDGELAAMYIKKERK